MDAGSQDSLETERLLKEAIARGRRRDPRLLITEVVSAVVVGAGALSIACLFSGAPLRLVPTLLSVAAYLACDGIEFPVGSAVTSAGQLALIPMLLLVPVRFVPALVIACRLLPLLRPGRGPFGFMLVGARIGDCAYVLGPAVVLLVLAQNRFAWSDWPVYTAALGAQFAADFASGAARFWFSERTPPRELLPTFGWLYFVDFCLTCVGLLVVASAQRHAGLILLVLPPAALLALFARERKQRMQGSLTLSETYRETAELLGDVLQDDEPLTGVHSREVAELAMAIAERLELDPLALFNVRYGALLHDVGKISVPKSILQKQDALSPEEWRIMREHTIRGQDMLDRVGGSLRAVGRIVRYSHEHFDGRGYPDGLAGTEIPIESRVVAAADAWNAMTTSRPYRRALSVEVAADEIKRCSGSHFDPIVAQALLQEVAPAYCQDPFDTSARFGTDGPLSFNF